MSNQGVVLHFGRGQASPDEIQAVVDEVLAECREGKTEANSHAEAARISPNELRRATVTVSEDRHGADPTVVAIIVAVTGGLAKDAVLRLWDNVVWPRLRRRLGGQALGPRQDE